MTITRKHRAAAIAFSAAVALGGLSACGDDEDDGIVDDDVEQDLSDGADDLSEDLSEGAEDVSDEVEEQVDEGAEENSDGGG
jgi:hypothetical protein